MATDLARAAAAVGALEDDLRRRMYLFVRRQGRPVTREEVAKHAKVSRKLAAFHLDKLAELGLLTTQLATPLGKKAGRGRGRTSKLYEPSDKEVSVSLPERHYEFMGEILAEAIAPRKGTHDSIAVACRAAFDRGRAIARDVMKRSRAPSTSAVLKRLLTRRGYEPYEDESGQLRTRSCPFHALSRQAPDVICRINRQFVEGVLKGLSIDDVDVNVDRRPGECCVHLIPS